MRLPLSFILGWASASALLSTDAPRGLWWLMFAVAVAGAWLALAAAAFVGSLALMRLLRTFQEYAAANRWKRTRVLLPALIWGGRLLALIGGRRSTMMSIRSAATTYWRDRDDWPRVLDSAGRQARLAASIPAKLLATNVMLEALAVLGRREAFAITFAVAEGHAQRMEEATENAADDAKKRGADFEHRALHTANYWRGILAYRSADFADARHWLDRAAKLDPTQARPHLVLAEIAALEGDEQAAVASLRRGRKSLERAREAGEEFGKQVLAMLERHDPDADDTKQLDSSLDSMLQGMAARAHDNERWQVAWAEIKVGFWLQEPGRIEKVLAEAAELGEASPTGRFQVRMAESMTAALRREGFDCEKPYFQAREIARWEIIAPHARAERLLLRAVAQFHRGMPEAALRKIEELLSEAPAWHRPPLVEAIADTYRAACHRELGRKSAGRPFIDSARARLAKGTKIRALEQFAKRLAA